MVESGQPVCRHNTGLRRYVKANHLILRLKPYLSPSILQIFCKIIIFNSLPCQVLLCVCLSVSFFLPKYFGQGHPPCTHVVNDIVNPNMVKWFNDFDLITCTSLGTYTTY
uniref:Uncharacterized protein n=1 Tax=Cacopsylla melanoneura TaxID=428564 RepID=A0A8D8U1X3_9HEMI